MSILRDNVKLAFEISNKQRGQISALESENAALRAENERLKDAMREVWRYAVHGCGTKNKDARGTQFGAIEEIARKAIPDIAARASTPKSAAKQDE